jgi:hypothetical protein
MSKGISRTRNPKTAEFTSALRNRFGPKRKCMCSPLENDPWIRKYNRKCPVHGAWHSQPGLISDRAAIAKANGEFQPEERKENAAN